MSKPKIYEADLKDFREDPENANKGTVRGHAMLEKSVAELGAARSIVVDANGYVPAGNKTREALVAAGLTKAIVVETDGQTPIVVKRTDWDLMDKRGAARKYAYMDNRVAQVDLEWDPAQLRRDLDEGIDLKGLWTEGELSKLLADPGGAAVHEDDVPDLPREPVAKVGDTWLLGKHRLHVGDATLPESIAAALGGETPAMMFTDPPWNVAINAKEKPSGRGAKKAKTIINDDMGADFGPFLSRFCSVVASALEPGTPVYVVMGSQEWPLIDAGLRAAQFHWSSTIIWVKDALTLSRKDFHTQYEPIWYGWQEGEIRKHPVEDRKLSDVWEFDRPRRSEVHPTMKPVALVARAVQASSERGDVVLEPFGGSGSTLIACEQLGRRCAAVELDPRYADVIIERWQNYTGGRAKRESVR